MIAAGVPFSRVPQSQYEYSNFGYALLGRIVTNASGMAYTDYVRRTILTPLGMASSGYDAPKAPKTRTDRKSTRLNSSHQCAPRIPSSARKKNLNTLHHAHTHHHH